MTVGKTDCGANRMKNPNNQEANRCNKLEKGWAILVESGLITEEQLQTTLNEKNRQIKSLEMPCCKKAI